MAKVIALCGKIGSGKTTYARRLCRETGAVDLSVDEVMLGLFGLYAGERHDEWAGYLQGYLRSKAVQIAAAGVDVVLDWGFWHRKDRALLREICANAGVACEIHYLEVEEAERTRRLEARNRAIREGKVEAYPVDANLAAKLELNFETPTPEEIDARIGPDGSVRKAEKAGTPIPEAGGQVP